jgi:hypothetical protein
MESGQRMPEHLTEAFLEIIWQWHLSGHRLPEALVAEIGPQGPEIRLRLPAQTSRWQRRDTVEPEPAWKLALFFIDPLSQADPLP